VDSLAERYFALIVPLCILLLAMALVGCWMVLRHQPRQRYLLWLAAGYALSAVGLGWQSLLDHAQFAHWAPVTGVLYLGGAWSLARGMAGRYGCTAHPWAALAIGAVVLGALFYYSHIQESLLVRMHWLNAGLGLMQILPMRGIVQRQPQADRLERALWMSFLVFSCYTMARPVLVMWLLPELQGDEIPRSGYWLITLAGTLLFALWFSMLLVACSVREVFLRLRDERNRDSLTRLLNRRAFMETAQQHLQSAEMAPWALLTCDIDHFKRINDGWGHAAGDQVLKGVAKVLLAHVRGEDLVARFGGEEFVLLLCRSDMAGAERVAQRIRQAIAQQKFKAKDAPLGVVTASFGLVPLHGLQGLSQALTQADTLLYEAKKAGRNRVCVEPAKPMETAALRNAE
jgi:diguanylate cyclase (GGDEF)-like protein